MEKQLKRVCGADIHKKFLIATILDRDGSKLTQRFGMTMDELLKFKIWVTSNGCEQVAVESTGSYWVPIYSVLEGYVGLIVANAYKIKHTPGRKTDLSDSEWIAELCLNGMIEPSRIFPKEDRELRMLTRAREGYVNDLSQEKNRIHHSLESCGIKLSSVLSDVFGKTGRYILNGLLDGISVDDIIEGIPVKKLKKKSDLIREAVKGSLEITHVILIRCSLEQIESIQKRIAELDEEIKKRIVNRKEDLKIMISVPGIGFTSAVTILAEIGNFRDFQGGNQLAAWTGLVPRVYQSADKLVTGSITKHGSRHLRRMLVEVAHVIARTKESKLNRLLLRVRAKKGYKVAIVALARKLLCIIHHLLVNQELYEEEGIRKHIKMDKFEPSKTARRDLDEMISFLVRAGYHVQKRGAG